MTVDIIRAENNAIAALGNASAALERLGQWVTAAQHAHTLVSPLVDTAFVPDAYKPKVDPRATPEQKQAAYQVAVANATAAVLQGITLGLDPLTSLQQIYIVHGRPGMYAKLMVAIVQSHGHDVWTEDESDTRVVVAGRRKGADVIERVAVTMDQARKAGWTSNQAYTKTPRDMLWARAAARVCDRIASDALKGIASVEEIQDTIQVTAEAGKTRTVSPPKRAAAPAITAAEEPPLEEAEPAAAQDFPAEPMITAAQLKKLHTLLTNNGHGERNAGLAHLSDELGRNVMSSKELTKAEAIRVIDGLDAAKPVPVDAEPELGWPEAAQPPLDGGN